MLRHSRPTFQQMLAWLMTEVAFARASIAIVKGLRRAEQSVLKSAPRFFDMTVGAHADSVVLQAASLYDRGRTTVSIHSLLSSATQDAETFRCGTATEVRKIVAEARAKVSSLEPILKAIRKRRNETKAHLAPGPLVAPHTYLREGRVSNREIDRFFEETGAILNSLSMLWCGKTAALDLPDAEDYKQALDLIARGVSRGAS